MEPNITDYTQFCRNEKQIIMTSYFQRLSSPKTFMLQNWKFSVKKT